MSAKALKPRRARGRPQLGDSGRGDGARVIVGVSLTPAEAQQLDAWRGETSRAEYIRTHGLRPRLCAGMQFKALRNWGYVKKGDVVTLIATRDGRDWEVTGRLGRHIIDPTDAEAWDKCDP